MNQLNLKQYDFFAQVLDVVADSEAEKRALGLKLVEFLNTKFINKLLEIGWEVRLQRLHDDLRDSLDEQNAADPLERVLGLSETVDERVRVSNLFHEAVQDTALFLGHLCASVLSNEKYERVKMIAQQAKL